VVAVGTPYDVAYLPGAATFITTYDYQPVSLQALVRVLFGEVGVRGKLPVTITEPSPSTKVLYPYGYGLSLGR
jgi:beta-N-acetylhexosaminidase